jgi:predicted transcriptional regulator
MSVIQLKKELLRILQKVNEQTNIEDLFKQIALLEDIYLAEQDIEQGRLLTHKEVEALSKTWK